MARVPQSKPSVPPRGGSIPFQRGPGSAEAFGAGEARTEEERVRAGIRISEALKAASARVGQQQISAAQRTGAARTEAVNRIGAARAGAVTRVGAARVGSTQRTGAAQVGATARTGAAEGAAAREAEAITGEAISGVGRALSGVSEDIAAASARIVLAEETLGRMEILGATEVKLKAARQLETDEGTDFRTLESLNAWTGTVNGIIAEGAAGFANQTAQGQEKGFLALEALDQTYKGIGTERSIESRRGRVEQVVGEKVNEAATRAEANPAQLGVEIDSIHNFIIEEFGPVSTPIETAARMSNSTEVLVTATINKQLNTPTRTGEHLNQASRLLALDEDKLEPAARAALVKKVSAAFKSFESSAQSTIVPVQKDVDLVDVSQIDPETGQAKVIARGVRTPLVLSKDQEASALNSDTGKMEVIARGPKSPPPAPFSDEAKLRSDFDDGFLSKQEFTEARAALREPATPIGQAMRDWRLGDISHDQLEETLLGLQRDGEPSLQDAKGIRDGFVKASANYPLVSDAIDRIRITARDETGEGDMSLLFAYITMLDPGSTVREGEKASAEDTRGAFGDIYAMYNKMVDGDGLLPAQRANFERLAELIFERASEKQLGVVEAWTAVAASSRVPIDRVVLTNLRPTRRGFEVNDAIRDLPDNTREAVTGLYNRAVIRGIDNFTEEDLDTLAEHPVLWDDINEKLSRKREREAARTKRVQ